MRHGRAPREVVAALIGAEVGAAAGLLLFGGLQGMPILLMVAGAALGPLVAIVVRFVRNVFLRRWLRSQLRTDA
jgi:ABC-type proline/glycine betaine transport system permease subunit